jgi:hypothetical protein
MKIGTKNVLRETKEKDYSRVMDFHSSRNSFAAASQPLQLIFKGDQFPNFKPRTKRPAFKGNGRWNTAVVSIVGGLQLSG